MIDPIQPTSSLPQVIEDKTGQIHDRERAFLEELFQVCTKHSFNLSTFWFSLGAQQKLIVEDLWENSYRVSNGDST